MHNSYEEYNKGFSISISLKLYARPAVIKALYHFHNKYLISYELSGSKLTIFFEPKAVTQDIKQEVSEIMEALDLQMIRYDIMLSTKEIRQLLVARALYTTCIEPDHATIEEDKNDLQITDWKADSQSIFNSWLPEQN